MIDRTLAPPGLIPVLLDCPSKAQDHLDMQAIRRESVTQSRAQLSCREGRYLVPV